MEGLLYLKEGSETDEGFVEDKVVLCPNCESNQRPWSKAHAVGYLLTYRFTSVHA